MTRTRIILWLFLVIASALAIWQVCVPERREVAPLTPTPGAPADAEATARAERILNEKEPGLLDVRREKYPTAEDRRRPVNPASAPASRMAPRATAGNMVVTPGPEWDAHFSMCAGHPETLRGEWRHRADADGDGDVDGYDFLTFANCYNRSNRPRLCIAGDMDLDGDSDGFDYLTFSNCVNGPDRPPTAECQNRS